MVLKTYIAAACAAGLVVGVVYFGTSPANSSGSVAIERPTELVPEQSTALENTKTVEAEKTNILRRYIAKGDEKTLEGSTLDNPYSTETSVNNAKTVEAETSGNESFELEKMAETELASHDGADHPHPIVEKTTDKAEPALPVNQRDDIIERPVKAEPKKPQTKVITKTVTETVTETKPPKPKVKRVKRPIVKRQMPVVKSDDPAKIRIDTVFTQAEAIEQVDLRDRAYLDLTDYATNKGMFEDAQKAALLIQQPELRDTARSRIAMGMARYGLSDEAFALIEDVEIRELRDVMRLQVIEALLGTDIRR